jgi:glycosyltransferase involved in cell wall biosynthesis
METVSSSPPLISVVIPTCNEVGFIDKCLDSIFSADFPPGDMEVLVVDGMSDDGTRTKLANWCKKHPTLRVLDNPRRVVPAAMNIGIRAARGKWIVRLDAHSTYPTNYFTLCLDTASRTGADNVGGIFVPFLRDDCAEAKLVRALTTHRFGVGNAGFRVSTHEGWADTIPYGCYRREIFEAIGLYDERLVRNQDYEINRRLIKRGGRIWLNPAIQIRYYNQSSLSGLLQQAFVTSQWNLWMWFVAPYSFAWRHAIPSGFVATLLTALLGLLFSTSIAATSLALILLPYSVAALLASFQQAHRQGLWMVLFLPFLFLAYHLAYGLGGLRGLWLLTIRKSPVQRISEPWPSAGNYRPFSMSSERLGN